MNSKTGSFACAWLALALSSGMAMAEQAATTAAADPVAETHRALARKATEQAAADAIRAVKVSNKLDLDIRLIGPTSVKIAGDRQVVR